jgi:hypothetical protein
MSDVEKENGSYVKGGILSLIIFAAMFFVLEWMNKTFASAENANPFMLPKMHLASLAINIILFRLLIRKEGKENNAKGILIVSFLYMFVYFIFINK